MLNKKRSIELFLLLVFFLGAYGTICLCQTFPSRTVSPLLKPTTFFRYNYHLAFFGQQKDGEVTITVTSVQGQKVYLSVSALDPDMGISPQTTDVGMLSDFSTVPFIGENLNVGDPVTRSMQESESPYTVQTLGKENVLGKSRTVLGLSKTLASDVGDTGQVAMKWDREGGFPILLMVTATSQGVTGGMTMTLTSSNVNLEAEQDGQNGQNWLSKLMIEVGTWVNSAFELNVSSQMVPALGVITIVCIAVALALGIRLIMWIY